MWKRFKGLPAAHPQPRQIELLFRKEGKPTGGCYPNNRLAGEKTEGRSSLTEHADHARRPGHTRTFLGVAVSRGFPPAEPRALWNDARGHGPAPSRGSPSRESDRLGTYQLAPESRNGDGDRDRDRGLPDRRQAPWHVTAMLLSTKRDRQSPRSAGEKPEAGDSTAWSSSLGAEISWGSFQPRAQAPS